MRVEEDKAKGSTALLFFRRDDVTSDIAEKAAELRRLLKLPGEQQKYLLTYSPVRGAENELAVNSRSMLQIMQAFASHLDVPVVRRVLPRRIREPLAVAAAADVFFTRRSAGALVGLAFGAVPFGRAGDVRASLERVATLLAEGRPVLLFPEGTRALDGRLGPMRDGVGLLAMVAGVPIVPVHLDGAFAILPKGRRMPRRRRGARVTVRIGAPLRFPAGTTLHAVARRVGAAIEALATEAAS